MNGDEFFLDVTLGRSGAHGDCTFCSPEVLADALNGVLCSSLQGARFSNRMNVALRIEFKVRFLQQGVPAE